MGRQEGQRADQDHDAGPDEFIRRFLLHVLPDSIHRIRHYGLFASATRATTIATIRALLASAPSASEVEPEPAADSGTPATAPSEPTSPYCGGGRDIVERFRRSQTPLTCSCIIWIDTS